MERAVPDLSLGPDPSGLDHPGPFFSFLGNQLAKLSWRARKHRTAQAREPRSQIGIIESRINLPIDLVDNRSRRLLRCRDAVPNACFIGPNKLTYCRDIRQLV